MEDLIQKFEKYIEENHHNGIFKTYLEIEEITGVEIHDVIKFIDNCDDFRRNTNMKWTTLKMYHKYRGFWYKFSDILDGRIR